MNYKIKEFLKFSWKKILLTLILLIFTGFLAFNLFSTGLQDTLIPVIGVLGFPLIFSFILTPCPFIFVTILIIELLWLYFISCILMKIIIFLKNKIISINWTTKKLIVLSVIIIIGFTTYGFFNFGWGDIFIPTADDKEATPEGVAEVIKANNQFSIDLYSEISKKSNENIFFSPWSISTAMAMVYEGARGDTAKEIQDVFHFPEDNITRRSSFAKMLNMINKCGGKYQLTTVNAIWLQKNYPFLKDYENIIKKYYLGEIKNIDFANNPEESSSDINNWISKNTNNKIKHMVSPNTFNELTRAVLTNAIYFKGRWVHQFDRDDTRPKDFTLDSGAKIKVPMMKLMDNDIDFNYVESDKIQILELAYQGDKISMLVLLPRNNISYLESILTEEKFQEWRSKLKPETVYINMPKYTLETSYPLINYLKNLGMILPFTGPGTDFSGMDGTKMLYINKFLHKAYINVYEEGTEAAATTTIFTTFGMAMPVEFNANHPFIFIIQEKETGNILFMGRVTDPTKP